MKRITIGIIVMLLVSIGGVSAHAHCDPGHVESLTLAVVRKSCHCGFTAAGNCKPCAGGEGAEVRGKDCMLGYSETGECLEKDEAIIKQCKCGYDAGKCLPCDESIINKD